MRSRILIFTLLASSPGLLGAEPSGKQSTKPPAESPNSANPKDPAGEGGASHGFWSSVKNSFGSVSKGATTVVKSVSDGTATAAKATGSTITGIFKAKGPRPPVIKVDVSHSPTLVPAGADATLDVLISLTNTGKKTQLLEFPSTQRVDAVLRDAGGQIVARANHAAEYKAETGFVTINPLERIEYHLEMPVQNLAPGKPYALEGAVTGQNGLAGRTTVLPKR